MIVLGSTLTMELTGGVRILNVDDVGLNIVDDGIVNQSSWALVVARLGQKESSNIGLQPLNRPAGESTLK